MRILRSKITVPQTPADSVPRPRLSGDLDAGRSLAFVAPAGFGKTTYAMQELRASGLPIAWVSLQPEDREPARFCALLWESVSTAIPEFATSGIDLEPESLESPESLAEALLYFAQEAETPPFWICLDNLESVQSESAVSRAVNQLLAQGSRRVRVALTTREVEGLGLSVLEGRGLVRIVRHSELVFSRQDISALMTILGQPDSGTAVEAAWDRTRGWPVAVGMWTRQPRTEAQDGGGTAMNPDAFSSFVDEVLLQGLEPEFRDFLFRTSFFDVLDSTAGEAAGFPPEEVRRHLRTLAQTALPVLESRSDEFQIHAALRDALRRGLRATSTREQFERAVERAARHLEEGPQLESAMDLLIEHELFPQLLETIRRQDQNLRRCWHRFEEWLAAVPPEFQHNPIYIRWKGFQLLRLSRQEEAVAFLRDRIRSVDNPEDGVQIWVMYNFALHNTGGAPSIEQLVSEAESWKQACPDGVSDVNWLVANGHARELRFPRAIEIAEPIVDEFPFHRIEVQAWILSWRAQLGHDVVEDLLRLFHEPVSEVQVASTLVAGSITAELLLDAGRLAEALSITTKILRRVAEAKIPWGANEDHISLLQGLARWRMGEEDESLAHLEELLPSYAAHSRVEDIRGRVALEFVRLQTRATSGVGAGLLDSGLGELDSEAFGRAGDVRLQYLSLVALRSREHPAKVIESGSEVLSTAEDNGLVPWMATGAFLLSWGHFHEGRLGEADSALQAGLAALESCGWRSYPMAWKDLTAFVYVRAVETRHRVDVARSLVTGEEFIPLESAFGRALSVANLGPSGMERLLNEAMRIGVRGLASFVPNSDEVKAVRNAYTEWSRQAALPLLRIRMFGRFAVDGPDGTRVFRRTASKRIFQMLLLAKGSPIHEEQLMEQCWPETDLDKGRRNLQTAINDLRKDLDPQYSPRSNSYVVYADGNYSLALSDGSSVDLYEFSEAVLRFCRSDDPVEADVEEIVRQLEVGRFELLPEARYERFCELERTRLRSALERGTLAAARALERSERRTEAVELLLHVLDEDPLWQDGVEALMKMLRAQGRNIAAIRAFRSYEKRLSEESGLPPDDRLVTLLPLEGRAG